MMFLNLERLRLSLLHSEVSKRADGSSIAELLVDHRMKQIHVHVGALVFLLPGGQDRPLPLPMVFHPKSN